jgi:hypothetical protein
VMVDPFDAITTLYKTEDGRQLSQSRQTETLDRTDSRTYDSTMAGPRRSIDPARLAVLDGDPGPKKENEEETGQPSSGNGRGRTER